MAATGTGCSKPNSRRNVKHSAYYGTLPSRVLKRKERNVTRSSHGKFTWDTLIAHQEKVAPKPKPRVKAKPIRCPQDQWITYAADYVPEGNRG